MQKTLTLFPQYITDGSNFGGILSANGTGQDYQTLKLSEGHHTDKDKLHVGTIGFDVSLLRSKSRACLVNDYSIYYEQKSDPDLGSGAGAVYACVGKLIENYSVSGSSLSINSMSDLGNNPDSGAWQWSTETDDSYHGKTCTFLSGASVSGIVGTEKLVGFDLTMALRSPVVAKEKAYMKNLYATLTYTQRYVARIYSEGGEALVETLTVEGGEAPQPDLAKYQKEGYNIVAWRRDDGQVFETLPVGYDEDCRFYPLYEIKKYRISLPYESESTQFWNAYVYDEETEEFEPLSFAFLNNQNGRIYVDVEYGKRLKLYAKSWNSDFSEDVIVYFADSEVGKTFDGSSSQYLLVFETEKLTADLFVSRVETVKVYKTITTNCDYKSGEITSGFSVLRSYDYSVSVSPYVGYEISKIIKNGVEIAVTDKSGMTISEKANEDVSFVAIFSKIKIDVTFLHSENITVTGATTLDYGTMGEWRITAKNGCSIDLIKNGDSIIVDTFEKLETYKLGVICTEPLTFTVTDTDDLVTVAAQECENGTIIGDIGTYIKGKGALKLEAKPDPGYRFSGWLGVDWLTQLYTLDTESAKDSYMLAATFEAFDYGISVEIIGNGAVEQSALYVNYDESVVLKALPSEGWNFSSWKVEREGENVVDSPKGEEITIDGIRSNVKVTLVFEISRFAIETNVSSPDGEGTGGMVEGNAEKEYDYHEQLTLKAVPNEGYYFVKWNDNVFVPSRKYVIPAKDSSLTAFFERYEYKVTASGERGKIELNTAGTTTENEATVKHGDNVRLFITADFGYRVFDILLDGVSIKEELTTTLRNSRYTLPKVTENHEIRVLFEEKTYTNTRRLIDYYPPVIAAIKDMQQIVKGQQGLIDELWDAMSFVTENQFIDTATEEGVKQWENELGIVSSGAETLSQRKKRLKNKWVPDNRFTMIWLYDWLRQVSERNDLKKPTVDDYVLTVTLPAIVDYLSIFADLEKYKPANISLNSTISLVEGKHNINSGIGIKLTIARTIESEVEGDENQTD